MAGDWDVVPISAVADVFDGPHATPTLTDNGPIFLGIDTLTNGRLDLSSTKHISNDDFKKWTRRVKPQAGDIVFSYETRIGQAAIIPEGLECCLGRRLALIRVKPDQMDSRYLLYQYLSPAFQRFLESRTVPGSTVDRLHLRDFPAFEVMRPPLPEQRAISALLGALDDKFDRNLQMMDTLEATARALFMAWLTAEGSGETISVQALIERQTLQIGDGYRAKNEELASSGLPFIRAANLNRTIDTDGAELISEARLSKVGPKISKPGDVAFTSKGTVGRFARVDHRTPQFVYSPQICFWRSLDPAALHPSILYLLMKSPSLSDQIHQVSGETDMAPYVSLQDQRNMNLPLLPEGQAIFGDKVHRLLDRQALLECENRTLAALRDALLPRLVAGELSVPEAETAIAVA